MIDPIILFGPTAVGKTETSVALAKKINGEIISADSMQVYRRMDIGTAKPTKEQRKEIPHHLIDVVDPDEEWTVSDFIEKANYLIGQIKEKGKTPIIVGGTGLYLNAFINGYSFPIAAKDDVIRNKLEMLETPDLYSRLKEIDPDAAVKINANDKKRIIRALEVYEQTGIPISKLQVKTPHAASLRLLCLTMDRPLLYDRINQMVRDMIKTGLIDEVQSLLDKCYGKNLNSMQALGYKETIGYLENKYDLAEMTELIKRRTRNFARRQLTWFRKFKDVVWIENTGENPIDTANRLSEEPGFNCLKA
ncbi:MAG: tRNA (adenosine(37)-N6)-dimethylallyltransferase MiaA [Candidatus Margulisiibacteriota bacterium]